jgi:restriction system protein
MLSALAAVGVSLCAAVLVAIGTVWMLRRRERNAADVPAAAGASATPSIDGLNAREFEALVGEAFKRQGYQIIETGRDTSSGLVLRRERQTALVLSKHWRAPKVGVDAIQTLHRAMMTYGATGGFALTVGRFSREATIFASTCNIRLIEGSALVTLINKARAAAQRESAPDAAQSG